VKTILFQIVFLLILRVSLFASHNRGGEITYRHIQGFEYEITIITYTQTASVSADRPVLDSVNFGDGTMASIARQSEIIYPLYPDIKINKYVRLHTYPHQGTYRIYFIDPNRIDGIINIQGSINVPVCIESSITVFDPFLNCTDNSISFFTYPIFFAQKNRPFIHNVNVEDNNHDSLSFELISCLMAPGISVPGYFLPGDFSINSVSGQMKWNPSSEVIGNYNFAVKINEWRQGFRIGYVVRDFQIHLESFSDTLNIFSPLVFTQDISGNYFTTVNPGDTVAIHAVYYDSNVSNPIAYSYSETDSMMSPPTVQYSVNSGMALVDLSWIPDSSKSRSYPYCFVIRGGNSKRQQDLTLLVYVNGVSTNSCPQFSFPFPEPPVPPLPPEENFDILVIPNPASQSFSVIINHKFANSNFRIKMFDAIGQTVREIEDVSPASFTIFRDTLAKGFYFVALENESEIITSKKIIIQ